MKINAEQARERQQAADTGSRPVLVYDDEREGA